MAHELGHLVVFRHFTHKKIRIKIKIRRWVSLFPTATLSVGTQQELQALTNWQYQTVVAAGLISGLIVYVALLDFLNGWHILILLTAYLYGSWHDIKILYKQGWEA